MLHGGKGGEVGAKGVRGAERTPHLSLTQEPDGTRGLVLDGADSVPDLLI